MKPRILFIAAAAIAFAGVALVAALGTSGPLSARTIAALAVAALTLLALLGLAAAWGYGMRRNANERATRLANLERRTAALQDRLQAFGATAAQVDARSSAVESELQRLRAEVVGLRRLGEERNATQAAATSDVAASVLVLGRSQGVALTDFLSPSQALSGIRAAVAARRILDAVPYLDAFPTALLDLDTEVARKLFSGLRRLGYLSRSVAVMEAIAARSGDPADGRAAEIYASELALYRGEIDLEMELPPLTADVRSNVVLHLVGKALPETQSGYTLRTQYTVEAQRRAGLEPVVVAQAGASERVLDHTETYEHRGIRYHLLAGPQRGSVTWDEWLRKNVVALAELVRHVRPAVIHTHSDFMNATIALPVGRAYGIPVVNETRGFWEESWLSRVASAEGWADVDELAARYGHPDMYRLRVEREADTRSRSDAVVTLARVMQEHIERAGVELSMPAPAISIAPNSVRADDFPVVLPDQILREQLGLPAGGLVIGYISSIVEYEGIDTLVRGMFELEMAMQTASALDAEGYGASSSEAHRVEALSDQVAMGSTSIALYGAGGGAPVDADGARERSFARLVERLRLVHPGVDEAQLRADAEDLVALVRPFSGTRLNLLVVGDGLELANLRALAKKLGLASVQFTGRVPHEQVLSYYSLIDLFVVPRKRAAVTELVTPLKPFEAMSTGRPCVFSDVTALAEIAEDSGCVALFRAGDHHHLAVTVARLLSDPERLEQMSRDGARWVRDERSWDGNALTYLDVYRSLGLF
ncbi:MAG: glycosyltransferase [Actinomycetota bacterium]